MKKIFAFGLLVGIVSTVTTSIAEGPADSDIASLVQKATANRDFGQAEKLLRAYRSTNGDTLEAIDAQSRLARGEFAAGKLGKAEAHANETYDLAVTALRTHSLDDRRLRDALATAIEIEALALTAQGARSTAVERLHNELDRYRESPIGARIQSAIDLVSLEGRAAPRLDAREHLGHAVPALDTLKGKVVLLFFWAHWCSICKEEGPIIAQLADRYRQRGLVVVAPTQRYGYVDGGRPAAPDRELRYIEQVRDKQFNFLRNEAVPISEGIHREYGVAAVPLVVLIDRQGVVRFYHPGRITEDVLETAILKQF
jgi:thiol-disulfide isomerase/thioredoxin